MDASDLLEQYLAGHVAAGHSLRTVEWYRYEVGRLFSWLVAAGLHNGNWMRPQVIEAYLAHSREVDGNAPATVAGHYRALQGFCNWLVRRGYIDASPLAQVAPPKVPKKQPKRAELVEFDRLLESIPIAGWIDLHNHLIINVLFLCGLRLAECPRLTADNFRTSEHLLFVRQGKGGHDRLVPLLPAVSGRSCNICTCAQPGRERNTCSWAPMGPARPGARYCRAGLGRWSSGAAVPACGR